MREYLVSKWEVALMTFLMVFGVLCLPGELFDGPWGADTVARFVAAAAGATVAVVARWRRDVELRKSPAASWSVSEWRTVPDVKEYAAQVLKGPVTVQLGGLLVAAGLPVDRELEYKVIVRVKGDG